MTQSTEIVRYKNRACLRVSRDATGLWPRPSRDNARIADHPEPATTVWAALRWYSAFGSSPCNQIIPAFFLEDSPRRQQRKAPRKMHVAVNPAGGAVFNLHRAVFLRVAFPGGLDGVTIMYHAR